MKTRSAVARQKFLAGYNCAQAVLFSFCDDLGFDKDTALRLACGFGAGMARKQEVCGAVAGGILPRCRLSGVKGVGACGREFRFDRGRRAGQPWFVHCRKDNRYDAGCGTSSVAFDIPLWLTGGDSLLRSGGVKKMLKMRCVGASAIFSPPCEGCRVSSGSIMRPTLSPTPTQSMPTQFITEFFLFWLHLITTQCQAPFM